MTSHSSLFVAAVIVTVVAAGAIGCAPAHVRLASLPPETSSVEERRGFYDKSRPVVVRTADAIPGGKGGARLRSFVVLNDGTRVEHASDLLVHVAPTSATGLAAARAQEAEDRADLLFTGGGVLTGIGVALAAPMIGLSLLDPGFTQNELGNAIAASGLVGSIASLVGAGALLFAQGSASAAAQERDAAFSQYGKSLRQRLALSADDVVGDGDGDGDGDDALGPAVPDANGVVVVRVPVTLK